VIRTELANLAVAMTDIQPHPNNVRQGDVGAITESLKLHGQYRPIVVQRSTGYILAGNHTYKAAKALKWKQIAATYVDCDDDQATRILLMDNRANDLAAYDDGALAEMLKQLMETEQQLAGTGFDPDDLQQILDDLGATELPTVLGDPDDVPDTAPAKTVPGDVWLLGPHRLMCGDSTSPTDLDRLMAGKKADMVWTDPPYGVDYVGKTKDALTIKNDGAEDAEQLLDGAFASILHGTKAGGAVYVAAPSGPAGTPFAVKLLALGMFRQRLVWVKNTMVLGHSDYHYRHEDIYFGYTPQGKGRRGRGGEGWFGDHSQTTVLEFDKPSRNAEHPTMKPVELIEYCLANSSMTNHVVLDLFGGSGSTLIAAHQTNRIAYLMELDPHYCDVICARYQKLTGTKPVAESTGNEHNFLTD
jgi:site-specific DNA-methyltransferase (adenine-specific)